jgi:oxygen-independent coproporphyrinogen-3 oxidase
VATLEDRGPPDPCAAVYVHVPFCWDRCAYCAFPTVADNPARHSQLVDALLAEAAYAPGVGPLLSLYLGGGTPGLLAPELLKLIINSCRRLFGLTQNVEITLEVNPANVAVHSLAAWADLGVTRISLGVQTFQDETLRALGRRHDAAAAVSALQALSTKWRGTWSADLLVGWAGQESESLESDMERLADFRPPHVSVYGLTVERGTPLASRAARGLAVTAPTDLLEAFDDAWSQRLAALSYERYEVSNFALPGHRSLHNQAYWNNASYLGLGPGAASSLHPHRWVNRADFGGYLAAAHAGHGLRASVEHLEPAARLLETLAIGLRTRDGLSVSALRRRFGPECRAVIESAAATLLGAGLLTMDDRRLVIPFPHLTKADRIVLELALKLQEALNGKM